MSLLIVRHGWQQFRLSVLRLSGISSSLVKLRCESGHSPTSQQPTLGEENIRKKLQLKFPKATFIQVNDISGGCGSMYEVQVIAEEFRGSRTVAQHRMVNEALKDEIKSMHGLRISTLVPD